MRAYRDETDQLNNQWIFEDDDGSKTAVIMRPDVQAEADALGQWQTIRVALNPTETIELLETETQRLQRQIDTLTDELAALRGEVETIRTERDTNPPR